MARRRAEPTGPAPKYKREKAPAPARHQYEETVRAALMKEFAYKTVMQVPRIVKVTVNMGLGKAKDEPKIIDNGVEELKRHHRPVAGRVARQEGHRDFKLRKGQKIGVMVTLRRERMWEFLDRLINIALPRVRDFRGVSPRGFDGRGNFTMGVKRADHLPRDRVRQDRLDQGHEHQHRHHGRDRRRGPRAAHAPRYAVPPADADRSRRRRQELQA